MSVDDEINTENEKKKGHLPKLSEGLTLQLEKLNPKQHYTMPPPRFSEASLVKELEENGIGRPSTYASIINVLQSREYVNKTEGRFKPTILGRRLVDGLRAAELVVVADAGHSVHLEQPETTAAAIAAWLTRTGLPAPTSSR